MNRILPILFSACCVAQLSAGRCQASDEVDMAELEVDHALTCEFPTPHTDWATPYALGKTRVLFFARGQGTHPRECVELVQRFDLDAQAVFRAQIVDTDRTHWHGGQAGVHRMLNLLGQKWDCFVLFDVPLASMPPEAQYKLVKAVADGAGLVLVGSNDSRVLKEKNRLAKLPPLLAAGPVGDTYSIGRGRGVRLPKRPLINYYEGWQVEDDYWHQRVGRAVLWAAHKEPQLQLSLTLPKSEFRREEPNPKLGAQLAGQPIGQSPRLNIRVRGATDEPLPWVYKDVISKEPLDIPLNGLFDGQYHVDAQVVSSAGVEAWDSVAFRVVSARKVRELALAADWGEPGGQITGSVALSGEPVANETLRIGLLDRQRRELVRRDLRPSGSTIAFQLPIERWLPMLVTVEAQLLQADREVARAWKYFRVPKRNREQFNFLMWDYPTGTLAPYAEESLARHGMTLQLSGSNPPLYAAAFDIPCVPYTTRILAPKSPQGIMQPFCWNDAQAVEKQLAKLTEKYAPARQHGVFVYSLGDENETLGCCLSPHCARAYRDYLRESYGSLEALNRSWGTAFTAWDEAGLSTPDDNEEAGSLAAKNYSRWFDRQAFKSYNYVKYCQQFQRAYAAIDPQAKTGFEGAGRFARGDDLDLIVRSLTFWSPYPGTADEVIRSIAPRQMPRANWMGYTKDADSLLAKYWRMVLRDMDAVWWWRWDCIGRFHGWLAPDLRPYPAVKEILDDTQLVRHGLGDLLLRSSSQDDGVALLYSYPSVFAHRLAEGAGYGEYEGAHVRVHETLRELGLQFRYVTDRMLRLGEFDPRKYKLLILARAEAIGDKEAEVIRKFVAAGGTVIADVRPGLYDDHCRPRSVGALDDLFGITRDGPGKALLSTLKTADKSLPSFELPKMAIDPAVKSAGPQTAALAAADGKPAILCCTHGKGQAVLLNFALASYPKLAAAETPADAAGLMAELLRRAGVTPQVHVLGASLKRARNVEVVRWRNGATEIVALFRQGGAPEEARVLLAGGAWQVYDLRQGKLLGPQYAVATTIRPNRPSLFVRAPRRLPGPRITLQQPAVARGTPLTVAVDVPDAEELHALRLDVRAGAKSLVWFDKIVIAGSRPEQLTLPIAYNDPPGEYEIRVIDLVTQESRSARLTVR